MKNYCVIKHLNSKYLYFYSYTAGFSSVWNPLWLLQEFVKNVFGLGERTRPSHFRVRLSSRGKPVLCRVTFWSHVVFWASDLLLWPSWRGCWSGMRPGHWRCSSIDKVLHPFCVLSTQILKVKGTAAAFCLFLFPVADSREIFSDAKQSSKQTVQLAC